MDGAGAQLFDLEAERRRRLFARRPHRPRRPDGAAELLLFTGVRIVRLPVRAAAPGRATVAQGC